MGKIIGGGEKKFLIVASPTLEDFPLKTLMEMCTLQNVGSNVGVISFEKGEVEWMQENLKNLKPERVLILGDTALLALTGKKGLVEWRGSPLKTFGGVPAIASFHPADILKMPDRSAKKEEENEGETKYNYGTARFTLLLDIKKCFRSRLFERKRLLYISPGEEIVLDFLERARIHNRVTVDVETKGTWVDCIGLALSAEEAICIPQTKEYEWCREDLKELFRIHRGLNMQNGTFDMTLLVHNGFPVGKVAFDTMTAHHTLWPDLPHDLHYLASTLTNEPYWKWMRKESEKEGNQQLRWEYNARDAAVQHEIMYVLDNLFTNEDRRFFYDYVMPRENLYYKVGMRGVRADLEFRDKKKGQLDRACALVEARFCKEVGREINPRSPKQLMTYLYEEIKLPKQFKRPKGDVSAKQTTNEEALQKLYKATKRPELRSLLTLRRLEREHSYTKVKEDADGRLRTVYGVVSTGRLNSKKTFFNTGWDSQNIPGWFRKIVIPDPGKVILSCDLAGADARFFAYLAGEEKMIEVFNDPDGDIHCFVASMLYDIPYKPINKKIPQRKIAKKCAHAFDYGMGPILAAVQLGVPVAEGKKLRDKYFARFPRIPAYHKECQEMLNHSRLTVTPMGRRRLFLGRLNDNLYRRFYAFHPQSSVGDYLDTGLCRVDEQLEEMDAQLLLQVHDEGVFQCGKENVSTIQQIVTDAVCKPVLIHGRSFIVPLEWKMGKNWGEMERIK